MAGTTYARSAYKHVAEGKAREGGPWHVMVSKPGWPDRLQALCGANLGHSEDSHRFVEQSDTPPHALAPCCATCQRLNRQGHTAPVEPRRTPRRSWSRSLQSPRRSV